MSKLAISRREVYMPGGIELTKEAAGNLRLGAGRKLLGVACGSGELELYLAASQGCAVTGLDLSERSIARAREKAVARGLAERAEFLVGDARALPFAPGSFDAIFCCGALCEFLDEGLAEFHRVLAAGGRAAVIEVVWRGDEFPEDVRLCWTGGGARLFTREGNRRVFLERGFDVIRASEWHKPSWWEAYYDDRGDGEHWRKERADFRAHSEYLALGLFVIEKR